MSARSRPVISPIWSWKKSVTPRTAVSPSTRAQMWPGLIRSSGIPRKDYCDKHPWGGRRPSPLCLAADPEENDIPVRYDVVASLDAQPARRAQRFHGPRRDQLVHRGHLGADEVLLEVGVDAAGGDRRG